MTLLRLYPKTSLISLSVCEQESLLSTLEIIQNTTRPYTVLTLEEDLKNLGIRPGNTIIVHTAMSKIGWIVGGVVSIIQALQNTVTPEGTLVMPTHSSDNSDPANWSRPPVPESWWQIIRDHTPAYHPQYTPTRGMGAVPEAFRSFPGVLRSTHPHDSFAAWGKHAEFITANHQLTSGLGDGSPLARIYDRDGYVLLIGVNHANNTSLHLAEWRSNHATRELVEERGAVFVEGQRRWLTWHDVNYDADDFAQLGEDYEKKGGYQPGKVGQAEARLVSQRAIVDFAVEWLKTNRTPEKRVSHDQ